MSERSSGAAAAEPAGNDLLYREILHTEDEVAARIDEMAEKAIERYKDIDPLFVSILHGAIPFSNDLMRAIARQDPYFHADLKTMIVSRYGPNREPGQMRVVAPLPKEYDDLTGRHVIILDDLIDKGETIDFTKAQLEAQGAEQVEAIVLVKKRVDPPTDTEIAMFGFEAPNVWLTGMGMDDANIHPEANRWAGWIAVANSA